MQSPDMTQQSLFLIGQLSKLIQIGTNMELGVNQPSEPLFKGQKPTPRAGKNPGAHCKIFAVAAVDFSRCNLIIRT
jgi:hypothetical protein